MKANDLLGMNARNLDYCFRNSTRATKVAASKILTKKILVEQSLPTPAIHAIVSQRGRVDKIKWEEFGTRFVIKPEAGLGGNGVLVVRKKIKGKLEWITASGQRVGEEDLRMHVWDILEGRYGGSGGRYRAFVEELVTIHPRLKKYTYQGTPDLRMIVYNQVPVMAMLRLPTKESEGRANLHQGAIGVGVDIATGITTYGVHHGEMIRYLPGSKKRKLNGVQLPYWSKILRTGLEVMKVVGLNYGAVDFGFDEESKEGKVFEVNRAPGLSIQLANRSGLRKRLRRVEGVDVNSIDQGVRIGRALFAERFADKVIAEKGEKVVRIFETVKVMDGEGNKLEIEAKMDTGAFRSSMDRKLAEELELLSKENVLWYGLYKSSLGEERRPAIEMTFWLKGRKIKTIVNVTGREHLRYRFLIGRNDLKSFVITPR